jgi:hypothetical protein
MDLKATLRGGVAFLRTWGFAILGVVLVCVASIAIGLTFPTIDDEVPDQSLRAECTYERPSESGPPLDEETTTTAIPPTGAINFGGAREWQFFDIAIETSQPITQDSADHLTVDSPRRFYREGANLTTIFAREPKFTPLRVRSPTRVGFTMCVDGSNLPSGSYTGLISVSGPEGFKPVDVSMTVNAKNASLFGWALGGSLIITFALLAFKGAADKQDKATREAAQTTKALSKKQVRRRDPKVLRDKGWWGLTLAVLGAGVGAAYLVYSQSPAWGDDAVGAAISVAGAVFAPAGLKSTLTRR